MSSKRSGKKIFAGTNTPAESSYTNQRLNMSMGNSLLRTAHIRTPAVTNVNFRLPVVSTQDSVVVHQYGRPYVNSTPAPHHCQTCYYANNYNNFLQGYGTTYVTNWLQGNSQRGFTNFTPVRFPPPARPTFPSAYPGNENPNALQGFNYVAHQEKLYSFMPMTSPLNIYMPKGPAPTSNSIIIIPDDDSPPPTPSAAQSRPLRTSLLVPGEEPGRDPSSRDKGKAKRIEEDGEHKCCFCNKLFDSGKALGGHISAHEKKRKRELTEARRSFMASGDGACSSRWFADRSEGRDGLDAAVGEDEEIEMNRRK